MGDWYTLPVYTGHIYGPYIPVVCTGLKVNHYHGQLKTSSSSSSTNVTSFTTAMQQIYIHTRLTNQALA